MALDKTALKEALNRLYQDQAARTTDPDEARLSAVDMLADAIEAYVKSGSLSGQVSTTGTAAAQTGTIISGTII